jgi:3-deoxy-D-manno-octulosonic-acid transferase
MSFPPALTFYRTLTRFSAPLLPFILSRRAKAGKEDPARRHERLGRPGEPRPSGLLVWLHGASVGESLVLATLVDELASHRPDLSFLVTTGTKTSATLMAKRLPDTARHQYVPVDTPAAATHFLNHWQPDLAVFAESEIWPNLIVETALSGIPMALVNARMNEKSLRNWARQPDTARWLLACFNWIGAADSRTCHGLEDLTGAAVTFAGNLKLEARPEDAPEEELDRCRKLLTDRPVWLAASTHPGEEASILSAHDLILENHPDALLILAPRHPERGGEVGTLIEKRGYTCARRSQGQSPTSQDQVWLADTLGEMPLWYACAPAVFVAGSLKPEIGGHNPVEVSKAGSAVITGPHVASFQDLYDHYKAEEAVRIVDDALTISEAVEEIWSGRGPTEAAAAAAVSAASGGALASTVTALIELLPAPVEAAQT